MTTTRTSANTQKTAKPNTKNDGVPNLPAIRAMQELEKVIQDGDLLSHIEDKLTEMENSPLPKKFQSWALLPILRETIGDAKGTLESVDRQFKEYRDGVESLHYLIQQVRKKKRSLEDLESAIDSVIGVIKNEGIRTELEYLSKLYQLTGLYYITLTEMLKWPGLGGRKNDTAPNGKPFWDYIFEEEAQNPGVPKKAIIRNARKKCMEENNQNKDFLELDVVLKKYAEKRRKWRREKGWDQITPTPSGSP